MSWKYSSHSSGERCELITTTPFLSDIVNRYSLQDVIHVPAVTNEVTDNDIPPELKDKKLQKLWEKAGNSGFSG
jgi:hypothetical protein